MAEMIVFMFLVAFGFVGLTIGLQALLSCTRGRPTNLTPYNNWERLNYTSREQLARPRFHVKRVPVPVRVRRLE